jgi:hypothetical protein
VVYRFLILLYVPVEVWLLCLRKGCGMAPSNVEAHSYQFIENISVSSHGFYHAVVRNLLSRQVPNMIPTRIEYHEGSILSAKREYLRLRRDRIVFDVCAAPFGTGFFVSWRLVTRQRSWMKLCRKVGLVWFLGTLLLSMLTAMTAGFGQALQVFGTMTILLLILTTINIIGHFVLHTWLLNIDANLSASPYYGELYAWVIGRDTYYHTDTILMFKEAVTAAILQAISEFTGTQELRPGSDREAKPVMKELFETPVA